MHVKSVFCLVCDEKVKKLEDLEASSCRILLFQSAREEERNWITSAFQALGASWSPREAGTGWISEALVAATHE